MAIFDRRTRVRLKRLSGGSLAASSSSNAFSGRHASRPKLSLSDRIVEWLATFEFKKRPPGNTSRKKYLLLAGAGLVVILLLVQLFYPNDKLLPFASVDGINLGGQKKSEAATKLDTAYANHTLVVYVGSQAKAFASPKLSSLGVKIDNAKRLESTKYPWYLRIVPTSLFWASAVIEAPMPTPQFSAATDVYIEKNLMPACRQEPVDATLAGDTGKLVVVPSKKGGQCELPKVTSTIKSAKPVVGKESSVRVDLIESNPTIIDKQAAEIRDTYAKNIQDPVEIKVGNQMVPVKSEEFIKWLDFTTSEGRIIPAVNPDRSNDFFRKTLAPKVEVAPGVSKVTTLDFAEVSRVDGPSGVSIDTGLTFQTIVDYVQGDVPTPILMTRVVPPTTQFTRTYSSSDSGLSALLENYARDHKGTYGISLAELSGKNRRASYNGDRQFVTASTYKLFVGYSVLKRVESGKLDWGATEPCFTKMISLSDNPCAEDFLQKIGLSAVTKEMEALGLKHSTFMKSGGPFTTANDLALYLGFLESGTSLSGVSRERMLSALRGNVHRKGIPAGATGTVANKVGFMDGLLHDAAIVYSPNGTYVLAVMTEGSSWNTIADLAKQIDTLRAK